MARVACCVFCPGLAVTWLKVKPGTSNQRVPSGLSWIFTSRVGFVPACAVTFRKPPHPVALVPLISVAVPVVVPRVPDVKSGKKRLLACASADGGEIVGRLAGNPTRSAESIPSKSVFAIRRDFMVVILLIDSLGAATEAAAPRSLA